MNHCEIGDCREIMRRWIDDGVKVQMCVTSPPYWGLRDYGVPGQLGLESTPEEYVANMVEMFRLVRELLADDGTLWLNLGDSYCASPKGNLNGQDKSGLTSTRTQEASIVGFSKRGSNVPQTKNPNVSYPADAGHRRVYIPGLKPKDLVGIPWAVARALQAPYYTGRIPRERDRVWLAAMIDGEGSICGFDHDRADGGGHRSGVHITITNTSIPLLDEAARIWPTSRSEHQRPYAGHLGTKISYRWLVHSVENKLAVLRELYPHLIAKRQQATVAYSMLLLMADAKRLGHSSQKDATLEKRALLTALLSDLNHQRPVTLPDWLTEPPSLFEPGWYLRSEITWCKKVPMPESVTDRPTSATEKIFLLSKSGRYYYDADAVRNPPSEAFLNDPRWETGSTLENEKDGYEAAGAQNPKKLHRMFDKQRGHSRPHAGFNDRWDSMPKAEQMKFGSNMRNYWVLGPEPYPEAHFATFPREIPRRCILAGSRSGDIVLDPFMGSGTTGEVAQNLGRQWLGCELNRDYVPLQHERTKQLGMVL